MQEIRAFASRELGLARQRQLHALHATSDGRSCVWNVFATPELSLKPRQWCFPVAGCVNYRGYFREDEARAEAARLRAPPATTSTSSGVPAYSTLG